MHPGPGLVCAGLPFPVEVAFSPLGRQAKAMPTGGVWAAHWVQMGKVSAVCAGLSLELVASSGCWQSWALPLAQRLVVPAQGKGARAASGLWGPGLGLVLFVQVAGGHRS